MKSILCPFCSIDFSAPDAWCPHFLGTHDDMTLDDYKDFISGEWPAETIADENDLPYYFMKREE
jgi:hypothetical protein